MDYTKFFIHSDFKYYTYNNYEDVVNFIGYSSTIEMFKFWEEAKKRLKDYIEQVGNYEQMREFLYRLYIECIHDVTQWNLALQDYWAMLYNSEHKILFYRDWYDSPIDELLDTLICAIDDTRKHIAEGYELGLNREEIALHDEMNGHFYEKNSYLELPEVHRMYGRMQGLVADMPKVKDHSYCIIERDYKEPRAVKNRKKVIIDIYNELYDNENFMLCYSDIGLDYLLEHLRRKVAGCYNFDENVFLLG